MKVVRGAGPSTHRWTGAEPSPSSSVDPPASGFVSTVCQVARSLTQRERADPNSESGHYWIAGAGPVRHC